MKDQVNDDSDSSPLLVTIEEAARRLSIGRSHIYKQMQRGALRSVHIGRSRRILNSDLEAFIGQLVSGREDPTVRREQPRRQPPIKKVPLRAGRR